MFCKNCNTQLPDNATFCKNCGARLNSESAGSSEAQTIIQPPQAPIGQTAPQINRQGGYYLQQEQQPQRASTLKIVALTLAAVVVLGGGFFAVSGSHAKDKPSTDVSEPAVPSENSKKQDKKQPSQPQSQQQPVAAGTLAIKQKNLKLSEKETGQQLLTIADAQISFDASGRPQLCLLYQNDTGKQVKSLDLLVRAVGPNGEYLKSPVSGDSVQSVELKRLLAPGAATTASDVIPVTDLPQANKYQVVISCINYADNNYLMFDYDYRPTLILE